ncbi:MAG: sialate O-acetylesterase [Bacteroidota bacterium]|nr:sialate O-acetylesterase [Bacteroidota bacterium]MDP4196286.1 sialate O-acetylesterase [Bacteroidota bacterium]
MKKSILILFLFTLLVTKVNAQTFVEMPAIFSDNMVLQQNSLAPIWGKATPGSHVILRSSWGATAKTKVKSDSLWMLKIKTPKAGGPFDINIKIGDTTITYKNVLTGEVWVCSGQSNMEMPLEGWPPKDTIWSSKEEIKNASNPNIRLFTLIKEISAKKQFNCSGKWEVSAPEKAAKFSATAYFFGKKLNRDLNIPIGLINTSWGGTPVESWMSKNALDTLKEFNGLSAKLDKAQEETEILNNWLKSFPVLDLKDKDAKNRWKALDFKDNICPAVDFDDSNWSEMLVPQEWGTTPLQYFDGACWFRKKVEIPRSWVGKDLILELGPIDDMDETFVNGLKVGEFMEDGCWQIERKYTVPSSVISDTALTIAVRVLDTQGGGGLYGKKEQLKLHLKDGSDCIPIYGTWKYLPVADYKNMKFYIHGTKGEDLASHPKVQPEALNANTPTVLYNAMIAPLIPYSIKGAIWYQGEANTGNPDLYKRLFPMMISNWREAWKIGNFPFYYVQIAPYNYGEQIHSEKLREAQLLSLSVPKTGMAVTLDIGNVNNIHPGNKKAVGERLASWALVKDYNKKGIYSGPVFKSAKIQNDKIILSFDHAEGGLLINEKNGDNNFLIAAKDGIFVKAIVKVSGKKLIVSSPLVKEPLYVRYAWSNISEATLFNKMGLPASSFRTDRLDESKLAAK